MKTSACVLCFIVLYLSFSESKEPKRSKLSGEFGITPFLRSGRSWDSNSEVKRRIGKMVSFPRIGRSDAPWNTDENNYGAKRPGANSGMWFGPRLGRVQKRSEDFYPWTYIILNGEGPMPRQVHYTPRLGRESEEVYEDVVEDETTA